MTLSQIMNSMIRVLDEVKVNERHTTNTKKHSQTHNGASSPDCRLQGNMLALTRCQQRRQQQQQINAVKESDLLARRNSAPLAVEKIPTSASSPNFLKGVRSWSKQRTAKQQTSSGSNGNSHALVCKQASVPPTMNLDSEWTPAVIPKPRGRFAEHLYSRTGRSSSSADSESILHFAVSHEDASAVERLLVQGGVDVNNLRPPGVAPLHQACALGNVEIVQLLLRHNADIDLTTWQGLSPLKIAVSRGNFEVAEYLVSQGAESNDIKDGFQTQAACDSPRQSQRTK